MLFLRSLAVTTFMLITILLYAMAVVLLAPAPYAWRERVAKAWVHLALNMLERGCGLSHSIEGAENIPVEPCVVFWKHQSAWETLAQIELFPRTAWVLKRELLWIPIIGWAIWVMRPVAIDRGAGRAAVEQVITKGSRRLQEGFWVTIFPEGTRMPPGATRRYGLSGALLAREAGVPIVPVAHNAGDFWRRRGLIKRPGRIKVRIGPPVATVGRKPEDINAEVQAWIEKQMQEISSGYQRVGST